jgi:acetolactate synthase I/II/III large subunit
MKLSDFVASTIQNQGVNHVFAVVGGSNLHLIHSLSKLKDVKVICNLHEQAAAMAADSYSKVSGNLGVATTTSGPGALNLVNGAAASYFDSVPVLFITGQVGTRKLKKSKELRQFGFQETNIVDIFKPITKYATQISEPEQIRYEIEKGLYIAKHGRPGPVLIDIPDDLWDKTIEPDELQKYENDTKYNELEWNKIANKISKLLTDSERPVIILGNGIRASQAINEAIEFMKSLNIPTLLTRSMLDVLDFDDPLVIGNFGIHGTRYSNLAVQNADLIISIGARLHPQQTGSPMSSFARSAKKIIVDIDNEELKKFDRDGIKVDVPINTDAKMFLEIMNKKIKCGIQLNCEIWKKRINHSKSKYCSCPTTYHKMEEVNPYVFIEKISKILTNQETIVTSAGDSIPWITQAFQFKKGQRLITDFNNFSMGYDLPGCIGSFYASNKSIICITGNGSIQMNIQELGTISHNKLPIKIFVMDNECYGMIQQTQDQWFDSNYIASSSKGGVPTPNILNIAKSYGFETYEINEHNQIDKVIKQILKLTKPTLCRVKIPSKYRVIPQVTAGRPIEDTTPLLNRDEFKSNMIIEPMNVSINF